MCMLQILHALKGDRTAMCHVCVTLITNVYIEAALLWVIIKFIGVHLHSHCTVTYVHMWASWAMHIYK